MIKTLELLAPARNIDIGIAAIDCGADAVYIAGPKFGARQAASNSIEDIHKLCEYAHKFGVKILATFNTIIFDNELDEAREMAHNLEDAGVDALIVQDLAVLDFGCKIPLHASTQCAIRTVDDALFYSSLGFNRIVLERELSLDQIKEIHSATNAEIEFFVHGALCVCYSGQCYLSRYLTGRSANRGECIQACRNLYDLTDAKGNVLLRNKALLSLKDYNLRNRIENLAEAGVSSFKIEGRMKNISYVKNIVRDYSIALDDLINKYPDKYCRSSYGRVQGGFTPQPDKTFNRGYTDLYIDGKRGQWAAMDNPKSMGEFIGYVSHIKQKASEMSIEIEKADKNIILNNGDGFAFNDKGNIYGFRGDICQGNTIKSKIIPPLREGTKLYRNINIAFEKELENSTPERLIDVSLDISINDNKLIVKALSEDGRDVSLEYDLNFSEAKDSNRMMETIESQLNKKSGHYAFTCSGLNVEGNVPFMPISYINEIRRNVAKELDKRPCGSRNIICNTLNLNQLCKNSMNYFNINNRSTYKANISNHIAAEKYRQIFYKDFEPAFEILQPKDAELMRTKYCIRYELGLCHIHKNPSGYFKDLKTSSNSPLFLVNNGKRFILNFDCKNCEMTVKQADETLT